MQLAILFLINLFMSFDFMRINIFATPWNPQFFGIFWKLELGLGGQPFSLGYIRPYYLGFFLIVFLVYRKIFQGILIKTLDKKFGIIQILEG